MTNEAIEAAARAVAMELDGTDECWQDFARSLRIAAPALMEEGARLALEAAREEWTDNWSIFDWRIAALNPADIVKGSSRGHTVPD